MRNALLKVHYLFCGAAVTRSTPLCLKQEYSVYLLLTLPDGVPLLDVAGVGGE
jgi:hypothetical protein